MLDNFNVRTCRYLRYTKKSVRAKKQRSESILDFICKISILDFPIRLRATTAKLIPPSMCPVAPHTSQVATDAALKAVLPRLQTLHKAIAQTQAPSPSARHTSEFRRLASQLPAQRPATRSLSGERFTFRGDDVVAFQNDEIRRETASRIAELRCTAAQGQGGSVNAKLAMKALKYRKLQQQQSQAVGAAPFARSC